MGLRRLGTGLGAILLISVVAPIGVAHAAHVGCGHVITTDTVLDSDVGPCPGDGIIIGADNVTLDLNGHAVLGSPAPGTHPASTAGIRADFRAGTRIRNGTVGGFGVGVRLVIMGNSVVERLVVRDNETTGIAVHSFGHDNIVRENVVEGNGGDGVSIGGGTGNVIERNVIRSNARSGFVLTRGSINSRTGMTTLRRNAITANGLDGVVLHDVTVGATVVSNYIGANNANGVRVAPYSVGHLIQGNQVIGNAKNGVVVERLPGSSGGHRILTNTALGNAVFDLADGYENCDANTWSGNRYGTRNQPCIN